MSYFFDPTTAYANTSTESGNFWIHFFHPISQKSVKFKGAITQYADEVTPRFTETNVYGKFDPILTYQNTSRKISLSWESVAFDLKEALRNLKYVALLQSFMYAEYTQLAAKYGTAMGAPPLLRVNFANLINANDTSNAQAGATTTQGLLCALDRVTFQPDISAGFFHGKEGGGDKLLGIIPKKLDFSCTLTILHEDTLGWVGGAWQGSKKFGPSVKDIFTEKEEPAPPPKPDLTLNANQKNKLEIVAREPPAPAPAQRVQVPDGLWTIINDMGGGKDKK